MSSSSDAALLARVAELEQRLAAAQAASAGAAATASTSSSSSYRASANHPVNYANKRGVRTPADGGGGQGAADVQQQLQQQQQQQQQQRSLSKKELKKEAKLTRKAASFLEKTELHASKVCGIVGVKDRIVIPEFMVNGGSDVKWEPDPCDIDLKGIVTPTEYFEEITAINSACAHARAKPVDLALAIGSGFCPLLLIPWGIRHRKMRTKHKKILVEQMRLFNNKFVDRGVRMRWRRKPSSELVIERYYNLERFNLPQSLSQTQLVTAEGAATEASGGAARVQKEENGNAAATAAAAAADDSEL